MPDWVGNLFLTSGTGITLTKPDTVGHGGTTINASGSSGGGLAAWSALTTYTVGQTAVDRGGIWGATGTNLNSRPISGNTDWTLVAGTPYVDVTLDPVALTTAPFVGGGPNQILVPAPGVGKSLYMPKMVLKSTAGDTWSFTDGLGATVLVLGLNNEGGGLQVINDQGSLVGGVGTGVAPINLNASTGPLIATVLGGTQNPATLVTYLGISYVPTNAFVSDNLPITIFLSTTISALGTASLLIRTYYDIIDSDFTHSSFFTISAVNQGTKTFTVSPTPVGTITAADTVTVVGSTGNNGTYTVASRTATTVVVTQAIPDATGDGWVKKT